MPTLHPNPPRLITVAIAVTLLVVGVALALPVPAAADLLAPLESILGPFGLGLDATTGYLALFVGDAVLVAGCLLPGI